MSFDTATLRLPPLRRVDEGDSAPYIRTLDHEGKPVASDADRIAGKPMVLAFCPSGNDPALTDGLALLRDIAATMFVIARGDAKANAVLRDRAALDCAFMPDPQGTIFEAYGVDSAPPVPFLTLFLLDAGHRVARVLDRMPPVELVELALKELALLSASRPAEILRLHAPVLVLPRMLSLTDCALLAEIWHRPVPEYGTDGFTNAGTAVEKGDFKVVHDGAYGKAIEYIVQEQGLQRYLDAKMRRRVMPEIRKAFQMTGLKREGYRIAGYEAREGGFLNPHRDNSTPANAHRRFTMTVNLNAGEYEGGGLRFREYGEDAYAVERGTAIIWSASLLHEVLPVTRGRRLVLGVHMFAANP